MLQMYVDFHAEMTVCDVKPCKNGGRCVVQSATEYVCVCPTCGCLSAPPLTPTCDIGELFCHKLSHLTQIISTSK